MDTCADILNNLHDYVSLVKRIKSFLSEKEGHNSDNDSLMIYTVSQAYKTIKLSIHIKDHHDSNSTLCFQAVFHVIDNHGCCKEIYCVNKDAENDVHQLILNAVGLAGLPWNSGQKGNYGKEIFDYLNICDRIAEESYLCSSGDDYYPGYFSAIEIKEDFIFLQQINYHNARSIDHKQNYTMRKLEITIPVKSHNYDKDCDHKIGKMLINFSDLSSKQNKLCGDKMLQKIEEEKSRFESSR